MKVLIVCSKNSGKIAPFILDQTDALIEAGQIIDFFTIQGRGVRGYIKNLGLLKKKIREYKPELIHAHYGMSGLLANLQRKVPVVCTYHGSDINLSKVYPISKVAMFLSVHTIFVSQKNSEKSSLKKNFSLIPCGVDMQLFKSIDKTEARLKLELSLDKKIILFSGAFHDQIKNAALAQKAVSFMLDTELIELKGYTREQVVLLMNAADVALMTSFSEGSPQFIKEAMACNIPIVSVPVGDVSEVIQGIDGCYLCSYEVSDVKEKLRLALNFGKQTNGRERILEIGMDSESVTKRIVEVYKNVINERSILNTNH